MARPLSMAQTREELGFSKDSFYRRAAEGDPVIVFLLERCMKRRGASNTHRRWDPRDVETAKDMERGLLPARARTPGQSPHAREDLPDPRHHRRSVRPHGGL